MTIVFWVILVVGTISATNNTVELNKKCKVEVEAGVSETIRECKQYYFDTKIKSGCLILFKLAICLTQNLFLGIGV